MPGDDHFDTDFKRLLWWLFVATRGGETRLRIARFIREEPSNINRICRALDLNYRTVEHHLKVLEENRLVVTQGNGYGKVYFLSGQMEKGFGELEEMIRRGKRRE
ncbi:transcriptional regulator [Thermogymnomonas acidicola]|uniref:Transcriptional regulator n=1 Tax=Thermogymnomonas acidicola TaxID=399579 RepID=A0AA37BQP1_9ARCH|nr:winged helix-turn-helix domain-containing protein [Thermogymnomonas acidicola]GGM70422.1 transcriptional regulator [Thermogymnomonas acidicola]